MSKSYGAKHVIDNVGFYIERGDRVALVGVNGAGKSTLIKLLAGAEPLSSGDYTLGHNVEPTISRRINIRSWMWMRACWTILSYGRAAQYADRTAHFAGMFSVQRGRCFQAHWRAFGRERNRYALARMLLHPANFLLLDEPTNHLDIRAKDVLLEALEKFTGTVVFVSHDRYFIEHLATRVFEIADGEVRVFPGNYDDYLWRKEGGHEKTPTLDDVLIGVPRPCRFPCLCA